MNAVRQILFKALKGERIEADEGLVLFEKGDLLELGQVANEIRKRLHPDNRITFVIDRNINYTNICTTGCRFCAFFRAPGHSEGYVLGREELYAKIRDTIEQGGTQLLIQGGLNPELQLPYFEEMLRDIKENFNIHIHSFSPPEIVHMAEGAGLSIRETVTRLKAAGLDSIPGGGAEILDDRVRKFISPRKIGWEQWMEVMSTAHHLGMKTTATMMFGSVETLAERMNHLIRVREVQERTGGFTAFIPWSFQPKHTELGGETATGAEYLRTLAISRIILDNVPNIQASWVTQGAKMAQVALRFGANDFGSTMLEENVVRAAGVTNRVPLSEIIDCIRGAGHIPVQRNTLYEPLIEYGGSG